MLDLKELEKKLDSALEKETSESLSAWLLNKRLRNYSSYLGLGILVEMESSTSKSFIGMKAHTPLMSKGQSTLYGSQDNYKMAS